MKLWTITVLVSLMVLLSPLEIHGVGLQTTPTANPTVTLSFVSQTHQALPGNCYNAQVIVQLDYNVTDATGQFVLTIQDFFLYVTGINLQLLNATNYQNPNNRIQTLVLFPSVPLQLTLSFTKLCIPTGLTGLQVWLFYFDGTTVLKTQVI